MKILILIQNAGQMTGIFNTKEFHYAKLLCKFSKHTVKTYPHAEIKFCGITFEE